MLSIEEHVVYPWAIDVAINRIHDFLERMMAKIRMTTHLRSPNELLAKGTSEGNLRSSSGSHGLSIKFRFTGTSSSLEGETSGPRRLVLKKRGCAREEPARKVVAKGMGFPGAPKRSDIEDRPSIHSPNPKVVASLKRPVLEEKYLLYAGYRFIIPEVDDTVNKPPPNA